MCYLPRENPLGFFLFVQRCGVTILACKRIDFTVRAELLPHDPKPDALMVEHVSTDQFPYKVTCHEFVYAYRTRVFLEKFLVLLCYVYFCGVCRQLVVSNPLRNSIRLSEQRNRVFLLQPHKQLLNASFPSWNSFLYEAASHYSSQLV